MLHSETFFCVAKSKRALIGCRPLHKNVIPTNEAFSYWSQKKFPIALWTILWIKLIHIALENIFANQRFGWSLSTFHRLRLCHKHDQQHNCTVMVQLYICSVWCVDIRPALKVLHFENRKKLRIHNSCFGKPLHSVYTAFGGTRPS